MTTSSNPRTSGSAGSPREYRDLGPRVERRRYKSFDIVGMGEYAFEETDDGAPCDVWVYEGLVFPLKRHIACVGFDRKDILPLPITYDEMRPGCHDPSARVADMIANGVSGSMCFPTFPRYCGQRFADAADKDVALACVRAYNDWMVDEWCGDSDGYLLPLTIMPMWDIELAVAEVRRNAKRDVHAVCFSEIPYHLGLPSIHSGYWEPLLATCEETGTVVFMHIGSASKMFSTSADAPRRSRPGHHRLSMRFRRPRRLARQRRLRALSRAPGSPRRSQHRVDPLLPAIRRPNLGPPGLDVLRHDPAGTALPLLPAERVGDVPR